MEMREPTAAKSEADIPIKYKMGWPIHLNAAIKSKSIFISFRKSETTVWTMKSINHKNYNKICRLPHKKPMAGQLASIQIDHAFTTRHSAVLDNQLHIETCVCVCVFMCVHVCLCSHIVA